MSKKGLEQNKYLKIGLKTYNIFLDQSMQVYSGYATLYILMAMIPLLMLVVTILNLVTPFSSEEFAALLMGFFPEIPQIQTMLEETIRNLNEQSSGLLASLTAITTFWSASNGVSAIQVSLDQVNGSRRSMLQSKAIAFVFTLLFVLMIPSMMLFQLLRTPLINLVTGILLKLNLVHAVDFFLAFMQYSSIATFFSVLIIILSAYTYLPYGKRTLRSQVPGALFTMIVGGIFTYLFGFFMSTFWKASSIYGSLAAIFLSAMWLKFIIMILFCGAALNKAISEEFPSAS